MPPHLSRAYRHFADRLPEYPAFACLRIDCGSGLTLYHRGRTRG
jgi:hypothetical protein